MASVPGIVEAQESIAGVHPADATASVNEGPQLETQEEAVDHARHHLNQNIKLFGGLFGLILLNVFVYSIDPGSHYLVVFYVLAGLRGGLMFWFMLSLIRPFSLVLAIIVFTLGFFSGMVGLTIWCEGNPILLPGQPLHPQK